MLRLGEWANGGGFLSLAWALSVAFRSGYLCVLPDIIIVVDFLVHHSLQEVVEVGAYLGYDCFESATSATRPGGLYYSM